MPEVQPIPKPLPKGTVLVEKQGTKFSVGLLAQAGTGYEWKQKLVDPNIVKPLGERTIDHGTGPGHQIEFRFEYKAEKDGMTPVRFTLTAPDKDVVKIENFDFIVAKE
jgi:hypothetical protein